MARKSKKRRATTKRKRVTHRRPTTKRRRRHKGGHRFTRASALAGMNKCGKCGRPIFGGPKGMATHRRKSCGKKRRRKSRR